MARALTHRIETAFLYACASSECKGKGKGKGKGKCKGKFHPRTGH